jgi:hypothetical protein
MVDSRLKNFVSVYLFIVISTVLVTFMTIFPLDEINKVIAQSSFSTNKSMSFRVENPPNWEEIKGNSSDRAIIFRAPKANMTDVIGVGIYSSDSPYSNISLHNYSQIQISVLNQTYDLLGHNSTFLSKMPAYQAVYTDSSKGTTALQIWTIKSNQIFNIIYLANSNHFAEFLKPAKNIIDSFRFTLSADEVNFLKKLLANCPGINCEVNKGE